MQLIYQSESNLSDSLSEAHSAFILQFIEREQLQEEAAINRFLEDKERSAIKA